MARPSWDENIIDGFFSWLGKSRKTLGRQRGDFEIAGILKYEKPSGRNDSYVVLT
jgi:hypothetical protein